MKKSPNSSSLKKAELERLLRKKDSALQKFEANRNIDHALEAIRDASMAMHTTNELQNVVATVFDQLRKMGIGLDGANINVWKVGSKDVDIWAASDGSSYQKPFNLPYSDHAINRDVWNAYETGQQSFAKIYSKKETDAFVNNFLSNSDFKYLPEERKRFMLDGKGYSTLFAFSKNVSISIHNYGAKPFPESARKILIKVARVFEQAYVRFLDLTKAEALAREAQLEAALEKIRSRSLAMHKSEEMQDVVNEVFVRLKDLQVGLDAANIFIYKEGSHDFETWTASSQSYFSRFLIPIDSSRHFVNLHSALKSGKDFYAHKYSFEEKNELLQKLFEQTEYNKIDERRKQFILDSPYFTVSVAITKNIGIQLNSYSREAFSEEENQILKRFVRVFEQCYARFLDLLNAEAQAREAQIDASLERIRASAIGMHHSHELSDVLTVLFQQFDVVGIRPVFTLINLFDLENNKFTHMTTGKAGRRVFAQQVLDLDAMDTWKNAVEEWKKDKSLSISQIHFPLEILPSLFELFHEIREAIPEEFRPQVEDFPQGMFQTVANCKFGSIGFMNSREATAEEKEVLTRFAREFERLYQRFLDLQKAEAQTRVAQIEVTLERVRARAMGMHHSDELSEVLSVLFEQFDVLGINPVYTFLSLIDLEKNTFDYRQTGKGGTSVVVKQVIDLNSMAEWKELFENMRAGKIDPINCLYYPKESFGKVWEVFAEIYAALPEGSKVYPEDFPDGVYTTQAYCKYGYLGFDHTRAATGEENEILLRFAKEFERLYRRFLDLKKAEAQAREAQIEAALERVRSRSMAMHKSEELGELSFELVKQVQSLGIETWHCAFNIYDEGMESSTEWGSNAGGSYPIYKTPREGIFKRYYEVGRKGETLHIEVIGEDRCADHYAYLCTLPGVGDTLLKLRDAGIAFPKSQIDHVAFFKYGYLLFITFKPVPEAHDVFKRFAKVFEQTYTRFLDLKKAEEQTREAQIEAALERVRSRTMAMQHSSELSETSFLLVKQVLGLGIKTFGCAFNIFNADEPSSTEWFSSEQGYKSTYKIPREGVFLKYYNAAQDGKALHVEEFHGDACRAHYEYLSTLPGLADEMRMYAENSVPLPTSQYDNVAFTKYGYVLFVTYEDAQDSHDIFIRFAKVFEQTYTRFLDLQKAEDQAREARIEAALERVRSRSMAMHHSEELLQVITVVSEQLQNLNFKFNTVSFAINNQEHDYKFWFAIMGSPSPMYLEVPYIKNPMFDNPKELLTRGETFYADTLTPEENRQWHEHVFAHSDFGFLSDETKDYVLRSGYARSVAITKSIMLVVSNYAAKPFSEDQNNIIKRFAVVFEQSYTRFLDLQNAEAQAREARIENALEKVRSRSLAMHKSDELQEVVNTVFDRLKELEVETDTAGIVIQPIGTKELMVWVQNAERTYSSCIHLPHIEYSIIARELQAAIANVTDVPNRVYTKEEKNEWFSYQFEHSNMKHIPSERKKFVLDGEAYTISHARTKNAGVLLGRYRDKKFSDDDNEILKRFARVFEQAYIRFLDLQKAEGQAREAQIEVAVERVRAKALAMHKSEEIIGVLRTLRHELNSLNIAGVFAATIYLRQDDGRIRFWDLTTTDSEEESHFTMDKFLPLDGAPPQLWFQKMLRSHEKYFIVDQNEKDLEFSMQWIRKFISEEVATASVEFFKAKQVNHMWHPTVQLNNGLLNIDLIQPPTIEIESILLKMGAAFDLAYKRFLDLQKAEAQAREAQIEASLERVRSKTMAMHSSQDVGDTVATVFDELKKLGVRTNRCGILIFSNSEDTEIWAARSNPSGEVNLIIGYLNVALHPLLSTTRNAWLNGAATSSYELADQDLINYYQMINKQSSYPIRINMDALPAKEIHTDFFFPDGAVFAFTSEHIATEDGQIFKRLAAVFGQTYRRYLDLKKAEGQAREATIEASLERVRAKAMAMHSTADLTATVSTIFIELRSLGIKPLRLGLGIIDRESRIGALYSATISDDGTGSVQLVGSVLLVQHPVLEQIYECWVKRSDYFPVLKGESLKTYYQKLRSGFQIPEWHSDYEQFGQFYPFEEGTLYAWSEKPIEPAETSIFKRFVSVLALTYKRYNELQLSEANTREAIRRASIDRVRAEIASMRTTKDLERITPLIWNELMELDVPFIRCGVFIMDEAQEIIHTFLSTPDGKAIGAFHLPYTTPGNIQKALGHWRKNELYVDRWTEEVFREFADTLVKQGALTSPDQYLSTIPHGGFYLHFLPFLQGMLYVGNTDQLKDDQLQLVQSVADAFSTAYARYEDFNKLESAKSQIEKTLTDLKKTQNQLVQSEKMASLGELTAGIAHEIQNPLNFVNNFSEVSGELLNEMHEEIVKGNFEAVKTITEDIRNNLEKILHHGKRADGIVKGMLQHSRSSSGVKEPTDINVLIDEYLRLAFHGFRAKDKSFNVSTRTEFDAAVGKIPVVPQDIGRVVLNLITNAFYAVSEKKKQAGTDYEPTVILRTKRKDGILLISVIDNGNGIPSKMLDKIFQPFFTTKPTGQGTGLGLSLSYDIVKAHGGTIRINTTENEGAEFIVELPFG